VRFKLTATNRENTSGQDAAYVDVQLVFDRLDLVCGGHWQARFEALPELLLPKPGRASGVDLRPLPADRVRRHAQGRRREREPEGRRTEHR
jgi:hypothetical protein